LSAAAFSALCAGSGVLHERPAAADSLAAAQECVQALLSRQGGTELLLSEQPRWVGILVLGLKQLEIIFKMRTWFAFSDTVLITIINSCCPQSKYGHSKSNDAV
jgi:hypothetical protein